MVLPPATLLYNFSRFTIPFYEWQIFVYKIHNQGTKLKCHSLDKNCVINVFKCYKYESLTCSDICSREISIISFAVKGEADAAEKPCFKNTDLYYRDIETGKGVISNGKHRLFAISPNKLLGVKPSSQ